MDTESITQMANKVILATVKPYQEQIQRIEEKIRRLEKALDYAKKFIDGYVEARLKENLGRDGLDVFLGEIDKIVNKIANPTDICSICGEEKPIEDLHRNCGK